ncbi:DNA internalization-related competence protein ComEC/Rec2 [Prauserella marina]|uniref:Competence protein ComEC n=1 Tax=Prauserella marina TaxID=530584 RepID=A0A222VMC5_9PSEU|nr:DNA internalization-related competence protein ComEC/Rec2 [Prauserella marina]ASR35079.1 DNA internalization-related competence protein ComEC/Rec2 [Prauserella marina]PWV85169.1 competence protein ComEC [Prauserella marina]SDC03217.1 competence protein ComEC [Prauserella marina]
MTRLTGTEPCGELRRASGHDFRLVPAAILVWTATLLGLLWHWVATVVCGVLGLVAACALIRRRRRRPSTRDPDWRLPVAGTLIVCGVLVASALAFRIAQAQQHPLREHAQRGGEALVSGTVAERPRLVRAAGYAGRPGGAQSVVVPVDLTEAVVGGIPVRSAGRILLIAPFEEWSRLLPGQDVTASGGLAPSRGGELTVAVTYVRGPPESKGPAPGWQRVAESLRAELRTVSSVLPAEPAGLLPGLIVGDTSGLPERVEEEFLDAGMSHLVAVSGSNLAIVCGAVLLTARALRCGPRTAAAIAGVALIGFVVLVGYEPSVLRAGVMGAVGLLALMLGRRGSALPALGAAVCVLVLYDPAMATTMGFALSVAATAGLVLLAPPWSDAMHRRKVPIGVAQALAVPVAAFLATAPLIAGMAGEVSLVSAVANLLAAPVVAPVTVLGVLAVVLAPLWHGGAELLVQVAGPGVGWLILVAREAASVPGAVMPWPAGWWGGLFALGIAALLVLAIRFRAARMGLALTLTGVLIVFVPVQVVTPGWPPPGWTAVACDVGQGDGVVLATSQPGRAVVVDTGPDPAPLGDCLDRLDIERVPMVVLSHLHADHVGGLSSVFDARSVGAVAVGPGRTPSWAWRRVAAEAARHGVPLLELKAGDRLTWPGLRLDVLGPRYSPASSEDDDGSTINNASLVVKAHTGAGRVLLTGDVELLAQGDLLDAGTDLRAEVLKVPHHGSRYSLPPFLGAVRARIALISVGADNNYGHPSPVTMRTLTSGGALVTRTDTAGDVAVVKDGHDIAIVRRGRSP